jgi:hypothetical protein
MNVFVSCSAFTAWFHNETLVSELMHVFARNNVDLLCMNEKGRHYDSALSKMPKILGILFLCTIIFSIVTVLCFVLLECHEKRKIKYRLSLLTQQVCDRCHQQKEKQKQRQSFVHL